MNSRSQGNRTSKKGKRQSEAAEAESRAEEKRDAAAAASAASPVANENGLMPIAGRVSTVTLPRRASRSFWIRVYLSTSDAVIAVRALKAIQDFAKAAGYEPPTISTVMPGSIFTGLRTRLRSAITSDEAKVLADQVRQTAEAMTVDKSLAENAEKIAQAMSNILAQTKDVGSGAFDLGVAHLAFYTDEKGVKHVRGKAFNSREIAQSRVDRLLTQPKELVDLMDELSGRPPSE
jgi:hypothetical protein